MTKTLLLCGCALALGWPAFAAPFDPKTLPKTDAPPPTMDPNELLQKIALIDDTRDNSTAADPTAQKRPASGKSSSGQMEGPTVITAIDTDFQQKQHVAVFTNRVSVNNASFNLVCDKLTAYLAHGKTGDKAAVKATPVPTPAGRKAAAAAGPQNDALDKAVAEGAVMVEQDKMDDSGNITHSVGHGKKMLYDKVADKITLYGMPDMQQGDNLCVATAESTTIVLHRNGQMEVFGPHKMTIKEGQQQPGQAKQ